MADKREPIAIPMTRYSAAEPILASSGADVVKGSSTMTAVASVTIHTKKVPGCGVASISRCSRAVATRAANAAPMASTPVDASPIAPSLSGANTGIPSTPRISSSPTTAVSAATRAVIAPPAHSRPASTRGPWARGRCCGGTYPVCCGCQS